MNKFQAAETKPGADGDRATPVGHGDGQSSAPGFDWIEKARQAFARRYYLETTGASHE